MNLRGVWTIAAKDLLETRRDRLAALFTLILPLVFTMFMGMLLSDSGGEGRLPLGVVVLDRGTLARQLVVDLGRSTVVEPRRMYDQAEAERQVRDLDLAAAIVIPAGFSQALAAGRPPKLQVIRIQGSTGAQSAVEGALAASTRLAAEHLAARAAAESLGDGTGGQTGPSAVPNAAAEKLLPVTRQLLAAPAIRVTVTDSGSAEGKVASGFEQSSPGMLINWILFGMLTVATGLVVERRSGTLRRLLTTRTRVPTIVAGKAVACFLVSLAQATLLILAGQLLFRVGYFRNPLALVLVVVALALLASAIGFLLATLLRTEAAIVSATVILSMALAALGGAWFPLEVAGSGFARVGHLLPTTALLDGLKGIVLKGWGPEEVLPGVAFALVSAAVLYAVAAWRFRVE